MASTKPRIEGKAGHGGSGEALEEVKARLIMWQVLRKICGKHVHCTCTTASDSHGKYTSKIKIIDL